eukprot:m.51739 g.51739  ORF g.51739 m.51739 type:complete len:86 (-) comp10750_c0_seq2:102-359(-)
MFDNNGLKLAFLLIICCCIPAVHAINEDTLKAYATVAGIAILACCLCTTLVWVVYRAATQGKRKAAKAKRARANQRAKRDGYSEA